jgi:hypothetical protein
MNMFRFIFSLTKGVGNCIRFLILKLKWWVIVKRRFRALVVNTLAYVSLVNGELESGNFEDALYYYVYMGFSTIELTCIEDKYGECINNCGNLASAVKESEKVSTLLCRMLRFSSKPVLRSGCAVENVDDELDQQLSDLKLQNKNPIKVAHGSERISLRSRQSNRGDT